MACTSKYFKLARLKINNNKMVSVLRNVTGNTYKPDKRKFWDTTEYVRHYLWSATSGMYEEMIEILFVLHMYTL